MEFIKYTKTFIDSLTLETTSVADLDSILQESLKKYLLNKNTFLESGASSMSDMALLKSDIEDTYSYFAKIQKVEYNNLLSNKNKTITNESNSTIANGQEKTTNFYYEPLKDNVQNELKNNASVFESEDDTTTNTSTQTTSGEDKEINSYFLKIPNEIACAFADFVNLFC